MKALLVLLYSITTLSFSQAQEIISTQGDSYSKTTGTIEFKIGEVTIDTEMNGPIGVHKDLSIMIEQMKLKIFHS